MFGRSYRLPITLLGIPVYVDLSFLLILPLLAWIIGDQAWYFAQVFGIPMSGTLAVRGMPYVLGLIAALGLFVSVVIHELGHAVTARRYGVKVKRITLWFLGGVAQFEELPKQRGAEAVVSIVGPLVSIAIGGICWLVLRALPTGAYATRFVFAYLTYMNIVLAIFNMLPALPLDGGRVLRSLLAMAMPYSQATAVAGGVSKFIAVLMGIFGLFSLNFFLLLVAIFIYSAVNSETRTEQLEELLQGARVRDLMNPNVHTVPPDIHLSDLMQKMFQDHHRGYPVTDPAGHVLGLVTLRDIQGKDPAAAVRDVMQPNAPMLSEDATAVEALRLMSRNGMGRVIATHNGGEMSGIITKTDLMRVIMLRSSARGMGQHIHFDSGNPI